MNSENMMNLFNNNTFDFSSTWNDNVADDDEIIIGSSNKEGKDFLFDNVNEEIDDNRILNIISDKPEEIKVQEEKPLFDETSTELDSFFDSIYNGVEDANDLITQINLKRQTLEETEKEIENLKQQIERERTEFTKYMDSQRQALETERKQLKEKTELQRLRISEESAQVKNDAEVKNNELELREQKLKVEIEKLEMQKANFAKYKEVEEEKLKNSFERLNIEKEQLEKEKELSMQTIDNNRKEFEIEKEHFERIKEIEESKLKSERENLNKNCERFKRLISGLSNNFNSMPNE